MAISAAGYLAVRVLGTRFGLPIAGLASGFISSTATIGAMGARAARTPDVLRPFSCRCGFVDDCDDRSDDTCSRSHQHDDPSTLSVPLICAGLAAVLYGAAFTIRALQQRTENEPQSGRAFSLSTAIVFAFTLSSILVASAALRDWFGETGIVVAAALAGFVDTHSAAISVASLVASGQMTAADASFQFWQGLSTSTISKIVLAGISGGRHFAFRVIPGLLVVALGAWAGMMGMLDRRLELLRRSIGTAPSDFWPSDGSNAEEVPNESISKVMSSARANPEREDPRDEGRSPS